MNALKAIIDTGATESVCGVTSMARMLDSYEIPTYHVVLLGGRELWDRSAVVATCGEYFAHKSMDGSWCANPLIRLRGRHVAIDLGEEPQPLSSLLATLHRPLSDRGDGDEWTW